jgi:hypothetical protein
MPHNYPSEYEGPILVGINHWIIHKIDGHHGSYLGAYHIKIMTDFGPPEFVCTCQAGRNCKHIKMITETLQTKKKDLF